jgi:hypothetical protein
MAKKDRNQLLDDHQEWVDHMYNPGYWVNRIGYAQRGHWRWARQHHRLAGGLGALIFGVLIATIMINYAQAGLSLNPSTWQLLLDDLTSLGFLLIYLLLFIASLILFFQKPRRSAAK